MIVSAGNLSAYQRAALWASGREDESSADPADRWAPAGPVAVSPEVPSFPARPAIDDVARILHETWDRRLDGKGRAVVGILVERGWVPTESHDEVLNIADGIMDAGGVPRLLYIGAGEPSAQMEKLHALAIPGGRDVDPSRY
ncbi:MAG: gamma-glutamyl-gamma-aminobutyrate hydrolase family protein, partial [Candidatus Eremiobacterota bacterium]